MSEYVGGQGPRRFDEAIRIWFLGGRLNANKIPAWTPEDEANLRRRVQRLAAKDKP